MLPKSAEHAAHTLSAVYYPAGVDAKLVGAVRKEGVVIAGGLHPDLGPKYFRVGHMGACPPPTCSTRSAPSNARWRHWAISPHGVGSAVAAAQAALID